MSEKVLFEIEKDMKNTEIAKYLRDIAEKLENKEKIVLKSGDQHTELATDRNAVFEIKVEQEDNEESIELEIEWKEGKKQDSDLEIA